MRPTSRIGLSTSSECARDTAVSSRRSLDSTDAKGQKGTSMAITVEGPTVGDRIGHLSVRSDQGDSITLDEIPGKMLVVDMFRGHW